MSVGKSEEAIVLSRLVDAGLGRPAGTNEKWVHMQPFKGISNAALWPFEIKNTRDGIRKGEEESVMNIYKRGSYMDCLLNVNNQAVFIDFKFIENSTNFLGNNNHKTDLYTGNDGETAQRHVEKGTGQDYIIVYIWSEFEGNKIMAINLSKTYRHIAKYNPSAHTIIVGNKKQGRYVYTSIRWCNAYILPYCGNVEDHHNNINNALIENQCGSGVVDYNTEQDIINAVAAVL